MHSIALYIHIPFCVRKCAYCDFISFPNHLDALPAYLARICSQMERWKSPRRRVSSVYIGGGTPSLLSGAQMAQLMDVVRKCFDLQEGAEVSMEANPGTVDREKLLAYRAAGIGRLSFGAQAMQPHLLRTLGRIHVWEDVEMAVQMAREAGFSNINIDLMYALPGQTIEDWHQTLMAAIALAPEHISAYSLILEEGTRLFERVECGELHDIDDDEALDMQRLATRLLSEAGLVRYEISNYAKPGCECVHNIVYWTGGEYLGIGAAAHSLMDGARFSQTSALEYAQNLSEPLSESDIFMERVMLGTRMMQGISRDGIDEQRLESLRGLVEYNARRLRLTERGLELHNRVVLSLLED